MYDLVVRGRIIRNGSWIDASICINDGIIADVRREAPGRSSAGEIMNFGKKMIMPGVIDSHVHMRDPGMTVKEDFGSGTISAAFGGVTTVLDMPNTRPPTINRNSYVNKIAEASRKSLLDFGLYLGIVDGTEESVISSALGGDWANTRPAAFKCFLGESTGKLTLSSIEDIGRWIGIIRESGKPMALHAEDGDILMERKDREYRGDLLTCHYNMRPPEAERSAIIRAVKAAGEYSSTLHFLHVSTGMGLKAAEGSGATLEVTPHHLLLDLKLSEGLERSEFGKVNPPIRKRSDRAALWEGIEKGSVNTIGSDHAPHEADSKKAGLNSPSGIPGVETMLPLLLRTVVERKMSFSRLLELLCTNPASIYGLRGKGRIEPGMDADLAVVGMSEERTIRAEDLHSKCGWTPYEGMKGIFPSHVISRGDLLVENGVLCAKGGRGRIVNG